MKKKTKAVVLITMGIGITSAGLAWFLIDHPSETQEPPPAVAAAETDKPAVTVKINQATAPPVVYEEIIDEETGETVTAQVQENAPPSPKPTPPPEKPKASGSYTNPDAPPTYDESQTVVTAKPQATQKPTEKPSANGASESEKPAPTAKPQETSSGVGQTYVEGFGYVRTGADTQVETGTSSGDTNKMVGTMD